MVTSDGECWRELRKADAAKYPTAFGRTTAVKDPIKAADFIKNYTNGKQIVCDPSGANGLKPVQHKNQANATVWVDIKENRVSATDATKGFNEPTVTLKWKQPTTA